jgi:Tfp pilus assembly protein PilF
VRRAASAIAAGLVLLTSGCASSGPKKASAEMMLNLRMATVLLREGRCADAEKAYREVLADDSNNLDAHDGLGVSLLCQGEPRGALDSFSQAVKLAPEKPLYRIHRGMALMQVRQYKEAEADFQWADSSTSPEVHLDLAIQRGKLLQLQGEFVAAEASFADALSRDPKNFAAILGRGVAREAQGKFEAAAQDYLEGVKLAPKNSEVNLRFGLALVSLHREALGRRYLERAVELDPLGEAASKARLVLESLGPEARKQ